MRKKTYLIITFLLLLVVGDATAQLERIFVETYYITDENDATDTFGGGIDVGSVTFRVYADFLPGTIVKSIYGDAAHPFEIASTEIFFNHESDGQSLGKDFIRARYEEGTVALDTWLTLGQTTRLQGPNVYFGIPKIQDTDGSFIGGENNDGGSEIIAGGLLVNTSPETGIPLIEADGMFLQSVAPTDWFTFGLTDFVTGEDTTMFGSVNERTFYRSTNFILSNSGVSGVVVDSNQVLLAQLTTKGELSFKLNIEATYLVDGVSVTTRYVGTNDIQNANEVFNPFLSYPFNCGCNDPSYIEYDPTAVCLEPGACNELISYGCTDPMACNYDVSANYHLDALCCYPGFCSGRDIEKVCPELKGNTYDFEIYPNPAQSSITVNVLSGVEHFYDIIFINAHGVVLKRESIDDGALNFLKTFDLSDFGDGIYQVVINSSLGVQSKTFIKL